MSKLSKIEKIKFISSFPALLGMILVLAFNMGWGWYLFFPSVLVWWVDIMNRMRIESRDRWAYYDKAIAFYEKYKDKVGETNV
jgi:hypothetical protein